MKLATQIYYMPAERMADLALHDADGLTFRLDLGDATSSFALLDCFGQSLRLSQRLLLRGGNQIELLTEDGDLLAQDDRPGARFVPELGIGPVRDALAELSPLRALLPIATGRIRTGELSMVDDEGKTCARAILRLLEPEAGNPVLVILPRGLRGYDNELHAMTGHIRRCGGMPLTAGNLYRSIDHGRMLYVAKPAVEIGRQDTAFDVASRLIASYLPVARANETGIIEDIDTEFLHDYRIAMRKVRSVLSLFKGVFQTDQTAELKMRFSTLMAPSGALRDLDVYLLDQKSFYDLVPDTMHDGLDAMLPLIGTRRTEEHKRLAAHLSTKRYDKEMKTLSRLFARKRKLLPGPNASRAALDLARELIWKRYRKIRRIASTLDAGTPDAVVHSLRIECKKLRYLMEFFGPAFPGDDFAGLLRPLKRLQDTLGQFNDSSVQQARLLGFVDSLDGEPRRLEISRSVGAIVTVLHQRQGILRVSIVDAFASFNSNRTQKTFRALFHKGENV